jgi:hypothetical protein
MPDELTLWVERTRSEIAPGTAFLAQSAPSAEDRFLVLCARSQGSP